MAILANEDDDGDHDHGADDDVDGVGDAGEHLGDCYACHHLGSFLI